VDEHGRQSDPASGPPDLLVDDRAHPDLVRRCPPPSRRSAGGGDGGATSHGGRDCARAPGSPWVGGPTARSSRERLVAADAASHGGFVVAWSSSPCFVTRAFLQVHLLPPTSGCYRALPCDLRQAWRALRRRPSHIRLLCVPPSSSL
jgi:hypothetical protein